MNLSNRSEVLGIKLPLVFGDAEQITALKRAELMDEFKALPDCEDCDGETECSKCGHECRSCDGVGKNYEGWRKFKDAHPGFHP